MQNKIIIFISTIILLTTQIIFPQIKNFTDSLLQNATLQNCITYALEHQPIVQQSLVNEKIIDQEISGKIADWFPQLNFNFSLQHNYKLQTSVFQGNAVHFGVINTSTAQFYLTQTIFDRDVLLAVSSASEVREAAQQSTASTKIEVAVNVSKAFYSVLLTENQIDIINDDITRLEQSQLDSYNQYKAGVVDKTDYMRATVALNNAKAEKKYDEESLKTSIASLKELMGYPSEGGLDLIYNKDSMENDTALDTTQTVNYDNRIEYKLLQTQKNLQIANLHYYEWSFIPTFSLFGAYNFNYLNDEFSKLYSQNYPSSYVGLQISLPIFEGGKRIHEIEQADLEVSQYDFEVESLKNSINSEYTKALADYKSSLVNYLTQKENLKLAEDVYKTIQLQYKSGVKSYLDVITSETDLRETQINYINALYEVLSSKIDVQKALGTIEY
jgi:outer membrane protein TolC